RRRLAKTLLRELVEVVKGLERPVDVGDESLDPNLGRRLNALLQVFRCRFAFSNERLTSFGFRLIPTRIDLRGNRAGLLILEPAVTGAVERDTSHWQLEFDA